MIYLTLKMSPFNKWIYSSFSTTFNKITGYNLLPNCLIGA